jgi:multidrug efflux pump subunit AcrA (membrane-fusion protein)
VIEGSGGSREVVVVPDSAVFTYQDDRIVFIASGPNRYQARLVEVGGETQDGVEILDGLNEGEQVVASGGLALKSLLMNQDSQ